MPAKDSTVSTVEGPRPAETLLKQMHSQAQMEASLGGDQNIGQELALKAIDALAEANSLDDIFAANVASTLPGVESVDGLPITIVEFGLLKSREEFAKSGTGLYVHVDYVSDLGEPGEFTTGATNVVSTLFRIQQLGIKDARIVIKGRKTTNGTLYTVTKP